MEEKRTKISETVEKIVRSRTCGCKDLYAALFMRERSAQGRTLRKEVHRKVDKDRREELQIYPQDGYSALFRER